MCSSDLNEVSKLVWGKYTCNANQLIYSQGSLAERIGVPTNQVKTVLKNLQDWGRITVEVLKNNERAECSRLTFINLDAPTK